MGLWVLYVRRYLLWWKYHSHKPGTGVGFAQTKMLGYMLNGHSYIESQ